LKTKEVNIDRVLTPTRKGKGGIPPDIALDGAEGKKIEKGGTMATKLSFNRGREKNKGSRVTEKITLE